MKNLGNLAGLLVAATTLSACSAFGLINAVSSSSHYERHADLPYGDQPRQSLDVYQPRKPADQAPVVVFFYGGGWNSGAKEDYEFVASSLTERGFVVLLPDYRLYPEVKFPAFVADAAAALKWALDYVGEYGGDPERIFVMGHSAGAHIAAMALLDKQYLGEGDNRERLAGFIGLSGPYDFLPIRKGYLVDVFPENSREQSQPVSHAGPHAPPTLLIHGKDDSVVKPANSQRLAQELDAAGVPVELKIYDGVGHARVAAALAPPLDFIASTLEDAIRFMEKQRDN
ncbi:MAG: alpha/beta hydrolase [Gammaproteobacteria bacterium]|nr:alpha/beta hydrolase [Gammaproteobacteria bacterium]